MVVFYYYLKILGKVYRFGSARSIDLDTRGPCTLAGRRRTMSVAHHQRACKLHQREETIAAGWLDAHRHKRMQGSAARSAPTMDMNACICAASAREKRFVCALLYRRSNSASYECVGTAHCTPIQFCSSVRTSYMEYFFVFVLRSSRSTY
jgi:hypothetical protein